LFTPLTYTGGIDVTKVEEYSSQIPLIVRQAFKAFGSDNRCAIVVALYEHDGRLTFSRLKIALELDPRVLTNELKKLRNGAIVTHYTEYAFSALATPHQPITADIGETVSTSGTSELTPVPIIPTQDCWAGSRIRREVTC